ncbi:MAG: methionine synthase [Nocardioidaceae bacterium]|nr:methionine synthase [Nocardioidaceae bacterium]MCL2612863.1 methionine synthase [Nocardioidaceae bacterium]
MARATGVGSFPGADQRDFDEALRIVLGELGSEGGLPFLPEVPGRGTHAGMTGRAVGLLGELDADLQPDGWRLTGTSGAPALDQRRARSLLAQDLDTLEERAAGLTGDLKVQVTGPWTLAATVERPRGDKVLADHGARRDLAQALAVAVGEHLADVRRRLPDAARIVLQLDEPALPAVLAARIPTASGFGKHRAIHPPEASEALQWVIEAAGPDVWVHCCAPQAPIALLRGAGATGVMVDLDLLDADGHDACAEALEAGDTVVLGVVPPLGAARMPKGTIERVLRWLDLLGLDPEQVSERLLLSPSCGLAATPATQVRPLVDVLRRASAGLSGGA